MGRIRRPSPTVPRAQSIMDPGWNFFPGNPATCLLAVNGEALTVTLPAAANFDGISSVGGVPTTPLIKTPAKNVDMDIAILTTEVPKAAIQGYSFYIEGAAGNDALRCSVFYNLGVISGYVYSRVGGVGTTHFNGGLPVGFNANHGGYPAWLRIKRTGNTWWFYVSSDGVTWSQIATFVITLVPANCGIEFSSAGGKPGFVGRIERIVNLLAVADPRSPAYPQVVRQQWASNFSGGMPAWFTNNSLGTGTAAIVGGALRLSSASTTDNSAGRVIFNGPPLKDCEILVKFRVNASASGSTEFIVIGLHITGANIDQYMPGEGYIAEHNNHDNTVRTLRVQHPAAGNADFEAPYTFLLQGVNNNWATDVWKWVRFRRQNGRVRHKFWRDGDPEPVLWAYDGEDRAVSRAGGVPCLSWTHTNGANVTASVDTVDIGYVEINDLVPVAAQGWGSTIKF